MKYSLLISTLLFSFFGCNLLTDSSETFTATNKTVINDGIEYSLDIPTNVYSLYDTLSISFKVKNISVSIKQLNFSNMQQLSFELIDVNNNISIFYPFIVSPATSRITLLPNETKELNMVSFFKDNNGNFINNGKYILSVFLANNNSPKLNLDISVN